MNRPPDFVGLAFSTVVGAGLGTLAFYIAGRVTHSPSPVTWWLVAFYAIIALFSASASDFLRARKKTP